MKLEFYRQILEEYSNIKFHEIRPLGTELFHADRRTERHDEANSRFSQFCEHAYKSRKMTWAGITARIGQMRNTYIFYSEKNWCKKIHEEYVVWKGAVTH